MVSLVPIHIFMAFFHQPSSYGVAPLNVYGGRWFPPGIPDDPGKATVQGLPDATENLQRTLATAYGKPWEEAWKTIGKQ